MRLNVFPIGGALALAWGAFASGILNASEFENNLDRTFQVTPGGKLIVEADRGELNLTTGEEPKVVIHVLRRVRGGTQEKADRLFANHEVTFSQDGNTVRVTAQEKTKARIRFGFNQSVLDVRYQITLPRRFNTSLQTAAGDIKLGPVLDGAASAKTSAGKIVLKMVTGAVEARTSAGDIFVEDGGATVTAQTSAGRIEITKAAGAVDLRTSAGDLSVGTAGAGVTARTSAGAIKLKSVQGDVSATDSGGDILIEHCSGAVSAGTSAGAIRLKAVQGKVEVKNSGGDIEVGEAGASVSARTSAGRIKLGTVKGKVDASNSAGDITVASTPGPVTVKTSAGTVTVGIRGQPEADSWLETSGGGITLRLPETAGITLDAVTRGGSVSSELPVTTVTTGKPKDGELRGKINEGGPSFTLRASAGNITIKKLPATGQ